MQKKVKGGSEEVGQRAEGGEKRGSSAFSSAFSSANPMRDSQGSCFLITFFLSQQFEGAWIVAEDLSFLKAQVLCKPQAVCPKRALRNER